MIKVAGIDVSRETFDRLESFADLVRKWTPKINLISKSSIDTLWDRHIVDSVQLFQMADAQGRWVDMGSGGGFPGIVIAILRAENGTDDQVTLIESDQRKCAFLRTAIRELGLKSKVLSERIENIPPLKTDILSARALADLTKLLGFAELHLKRDGVALFPKGSNWRAEHEDAQRMWSYSCEDISSTTNASAAILKIKDIIRV
jgi:16S rRNA (guanine527-N7)-methyltransferase